MRFSIIERGDQDSNSIAKYIQDRCIEKNWKWNPKNPEIVFSVGGDGTLLRGIHQYIDQLDQIYFVGIHTGTLGFFTDYTRDQVDDFLQDVFSHRPEIESFPLLKIRLPENQGLFYAFNEVRIESLEKTLSLRIYIDDEFFEQTRGSGICLSTQFGSTAINRALAGAVVDSGLQVMQLTEIMPIAHKNHHSLRNPYIMRQDRKIRITADSLDRSQACYDHLSISMDGLHEIWVQTSDKKVQFARYRKYSYLKRLKNLY